MGEQVGSKLYSLRSGETRILLFYCPGCDGAHPYHVGNPTGPTWSWNGDGDKPTFTPSLRVLNHSGGTSCHLFLTDGMIHYCSDSPHELAGKTVPCPDFPEDPE